MELRSSRAGQERENERASAHRVDGNQVTVGQWEGVKIGWGFCKTGMHLWLLSQRVNKMWLKLFVCVVCVRGVWARSRKWQAPTELHLECFCPTSKVAATSKVARTLG
jgi:hypothetical protein